MLTRYHVAVRNFGGTNSTLIRSTLSGVALVVENRLYDHLASGGEFDTGEADEAARLLRDHFLVPDAASDRGRILRHIDSIIARPTVMSVTVMTTGACNMACRYCFQNDLLPDHLHFRPDAIDPLVEWIGDTARKLRVKSVMVHFYGGEPLLNMPLIERVVDGVRPRLSRARIGWQMSLTTNGSLMSKPVADRLYQMGCGLAIVSLDGTAEVQNFRRPLKNNAKSSFEEVMSGIENGIRHFDVMLRTNIDKQNEGNLAELIDLLKAKKFLDHPRFFHALEVVGPILHPNAHLNQHLMSHQEAGAAIAKGFRAQAEAGVRLYGNMPSEVACEHINSAAFTVDPHGSIFPCPGFVGLEGFSIGNVRQGADMGKMTALYSIRPWEREPCVDCKYLPQCRGGCRSCGYITRTHEGEEAPYDSIYCRKDFFDATFPEYLEALYVQEGVTGPARRLPGTSC